MDFLRWAATQQDRRSEKCCKLSIALPIGPIKRRRQLFCALRIIGVVPCHASTIGIQRRY